MIEAQRRGNRNLLVALKLGLLGREISHSRSPLLHAAGLRSLERVGTYAVWETSTQSELAAQLDRLRAGDVHGANVTTPWKQAVAERCDQVFRCERGADVGVGPRLVADLSEVRRPVNTLFSAEGVLCGTSTDGPGLGLALTRRGVDVLAGPIALLGAGGAGGSVAHWLVDCGADLRWISNRSPAAAEALQSALQVRNHRVAVVPWQAPTPLAEAGLIFHASKVGHGCEGAQAEAAAAHLAHLPWREWAPSATLVDLVYGDTPTAAQRCALAAGMPSARVCLGSGQAMLACQAALSLAIWTGAAPPVEAMLAVLK